jgi:hypothetical protein
MKSNPSASSVLFPVRSAAAAFGLAGVVLALSLPTRAGGIDDTSYPERETGHVLSVRDERPPVVAGAPRAAKTPAPALVRVHAKSHERSRVEYDDHGDQGLWARGENYKVGLGLAGTIYVPFLGSKASRDFPVTLRVASASVGGVAIAFDSAVEPQRADDIGGIGDVGDVVRYARGGFDEVYELGLASIEQRFVFDELPASGELVVRVSAESELAAREIDEGLRFENDLGAVRYGRATAIDASGMSVAAPTSLTSSGIEIRVPAEFVASARLPLVIDPVVSTFTVDTTQIDSFYPDVAYDVALDRWLTVYEEVFSATDHDIHYRLLTASGASIHDDYAELSITQNWQHPAVAYNRRLANFLIVADTGFAPNRVIQGRLVANDGIPSGPAIVISTNDHPGDKSTPDVGGDPRASGNTLFCIVWEHAWNTSVHDIDYRMLSPEGFLQGTNTLAIDNSSGPPNREPSISKSNGGEEWNVAWQRDNGSIRGARIGNAGALVVPPFVITSSNGPTHASASTSLTGTDQWIAAYQFDGSGSQDIGLSSINGNVVEPYSINLSGYEQVTGLSNTWFEEQVRPDIDSDGETFTVVYSESFNGSTTDYDIYAASLALTGTRIAVTEGHKNLAFSSTHEDYPKLASRGGSGGGLQRYFAIWHDVVNPTAQSADIEAGLYDAPLFTPFCVPGLIWTIGCPCSNSPIALDRGCNNSANTGGAKLVASGNPSLASDTALLTSSATLPNALSVFNQGNLVLSNAAPFGQGIRCVGGSLKRLYTKTASSGSASAPIGADPKISARSAALGDPIAPGSTRGYYVYYRDPIVHAGCPSTSTFNTTQAIQAVWVP